MGLRRLTRTPLAFWVTVIALAIVTGLVVARAVHGAQAQAARFGSLRTAVVVTRPVDAGVVLAPTDVTLRQVPLAFLPEGWTSSEGDAVGRTVVVRLFRGQPVLRGHVAPSGLQGVAALLPPGTRAIAVPVGASTAALRRGDIVDVLATFDRQQAGDREPTFPVALEAAVVDVGPESATLAVAPEEAKRVAFAMAHGVVNLTIRPGPTRP